MTFEKFKKLITDCLDVDPDLITPDASFKDDMGLDSLDLAELIMHIEDEMEIEIPDEVYDKIETVKDALEQFEQLM